jgi:hypothetical protein
LTGNNISLLLFVVFAAFGLSSQTPLTQPVPVRIADATCARCHEAIYRSYLATPMANASGMAVDNLIPGSFLHISSQVNYEVSAETGKAVLSWREIREPRLSVQWPLDYFLGSGHLGITYLYTINHYLLESPVAWYTDLHHYDMKPGLGKITQTPPPLLAETGCLRCHMSAVQKSDPGTLNRYSGLAFLQGGTTCETCHGDSAEHVRTGGKASVVNPARLDADRRDSICISCHLEGDVSVERAGQSALDFRPGDSISRFLTYYVAAGKDVTTRGVSEVEQLSGSMCKRASGDRMSCTTCHDPHSTPPAQSRVTFFRNKCLACHNSEQFAASHHPENPDCTSCHMPKSSAQNIPHVAWTDHRILRRPDLAATETSKSTSENLTPIFSPDANSRDLAMAYYKLLMDGNRAAEPKAWALLNQSRDQLADDKEALDALGILTLERGRQADEHSSQEDATHIFQRVLALDPKDFTAASDLAILLAKQGNLKEAEALLRPVFQRNQDIPGLALNLAHVQCALGDADAARATLETVLLYGPAVQEARRMLQQIAGCSAKKP